MTPRPIPTTPYKAADLEERSVPVTRTVLLLAGLYVLLLTPLFFVTGSTYSSGSDLHAAIEVVGSLLGLAAGLGFVLRFYALGSRLLLFIGLAFLVNAAEDMVHGVLSFRHTAAFLRMDPLELNSFIPITDVLAQAMLGVLLLTAPFLANALKTTENRKRETAFYALTATAIAGSATVLAYSIRLPSFIYPENFVARPADLLGAAILGAAFVVYMHSYIRRRDNLYCWIALSLAFSIASQIIMSASTALHDAAFDLAHMYKVFAYLVPIVGFVIHQIADTSRARLAHERAEAALREIRPLQAALHEHTIISVTDPNGVIIDANEAFCRMSGYNREELIGRNHNIVNSGTHDGKFWRAFWATISAGRPWRSEMCNRRKDGTLYWVDAIIVPYAGADGAIERFVSVRFDITSRKTAEERLMLAMAASRIGLWDWDFATGKTFFSDSYYTTLGYDPGELPMEVRTAVELAHPDDVAETNTQLERHIRGETPIFQHEIRLRRKNGSWLWVREVGQIVEREPDGSPRRMIGLHIDIDESMRLDRALRSVIALRVHDSQNETINQLCRAVAGVFGVAYAGVVRTYEHDDDTVHGTLIGGWYNNQPAPSAEYDLEGTPCGRTYQQEFCLHEHSVAELYPEDKILVDMGAQSYAGLRLQDSQGQQIGIMMIVHTERMPLTVDVQATMRLFGARAAAELERATIEASLREAKESAEAANVAKSAFLANMSHEIRTPMTAILGYTEMLDDKENNPPDREQATQALVAIRRNANHLMAVINDILDVSKIEAGRMTVERIPTDPIEVINDVVALLEPEAAQRGIDFVVEYASALPDLIISDPTRLRQILINLVSNAIKFTDQGRVTIKADCDFKAERLRLEVRDTGIGMTPEQCAAISKFEAFHQADGSTTRRYGGTGLGLRISHALVRRLGGTLEIDSEFGSGTTFRFTVETGHLNGLTARPPEEPSAAASAAPPKQALAGLRVLLAEDGPDNQKLLSYFLTHSGAEVEIAENGRVACEAAAARTFDLILMDMQMPELDGYEATRRLRREGFRIPIIAITAHTMGGERARCIKAGCDDYLTKPINRGKLVRSCAYWGRPGEHRGVA